MFVNVNYTNWIIIDINRFMEEYILNQILTTLFVTQDELKSKMCLNHIANIRYVSEDH